MQYLHSVLELALVHNKFEILEEQQFILMLHLCGVLLYLVRLSILSLIRPLIGILLLQL